MQASLYPSFIRESRLISLSMNILIPYIAGAGLLCALIALCIIDWRSYRLPDAITLPLIAAGLTYSFISGGGVKAALIGAGLGYGAFFTLEIAYKVLRGRDGLGRGDAKLLAAGGAWCGWMGLPFIVLIASGSALACLLLPSVRKRALEDNKLPFGPFLALGVFTVWLSLIFAL